MPYLGCFGETPFLGLFERGCVTPKRVNLKWTPAFSPSEKDVTHM